MILQTRKTYKLGQWDCFKNIIKNEGFKGLFKGTLVTYARDMPSFATYFLVYESLQQNIFEKSKEVSEEEESKIVERNIFGTIMSGALAGIAGWTVAIPADVIKNRHQVNSGSKSAIQNAKDLFKIKGFRGFFLGAGPILLRAGPANAAAFLGYESAISCLAYFY